MRGEVSGKHSEDKVLARPQGYNRPEVQGDYFSCATVPHVSMFYLNSMDKGTTCTCGL